MTLLPSEHLMVHRNIRLEKPLFYKNPYGLRFELVLTRWRRNPSSAFFQYFTLTE